MEVAINSEDSIRNARVKANPLEAKDIFYIISFLLNFLEEISLIRLNGF